MAPTGEILEPQRGPKARLAVLEAELLRLPEPADGAALAWHRTVIDAVAPAPLPWMRPRTDPSGRS
jgi:hypothetical protein